MDKTTTEKLYELKDHYGTNAKLASALGISERNIYRYLGPEGGIPRSKPVLKLVDHLYAKMWADKA